MRNANETKKLNNKGFSLVELIIVIAIMAVLIAVIAPQYLRYVERSRESADLDNYKSVISALEVYAADVANPTLPSGTITFAQNTGAATTETVYEAALTDSGVDLGNVTMRSVRFSHDDAGTGNAVMTITNTAGVITITTNNADLNAAIGQ